MLWQVINQILNMVVKDITKQKRPTRQKNIIPSDELNTHEYGMPSGHAQQTVSEMVFILLAFKNMWAKIYAVFQTVLTISQRYLYRKHSALQLFVGSVIGLFMGLVFYNYISRHKYFHAGSTRPYF